LKKLKGSDNILEMELGVIHSIEVIPDVPFLLKVPLEK
jgi:hypothetical protein